MSTTTRVVVVDDHAAMRDTMAECIDRLPGFRVIERLASAEATLQALDDAVPDLVVLDLSLPGMSGDELVAALRERAPTVACLVLSGHREAHYVSRAREAGARGYVLKGRPELLQAAVQEIAAGGTSFS